MFLICSCGFKEEFNKKDDSKDYARAGWQIIGINIKENAPYYECQKCQTKRLNNKIVPFIYIKSESELKFDGEEESLYIKA